MSTSVAVAHYCDARECDKAVTGEHWTALGAQATTRGSLNRAGWLSVRLEATRHHGAVTLHFCPDHQEAPRVSRKSVDHGNLPHWIWSAE